MIRSKPKQPYGFEVPHNCGIATDHIQEAQLFRSPLRGPAGTCRRSRTLSPMPRSARKAHFCPATQVRASPWYGPSTVKTPASTTYLVARASRKVSATCSSRTFYNVTVALPYLGGSGPRLSGFSATRALGFPGGLVRHGAADVIRAPAQAVLPGRRRELRGAPVHGLGHDAPGAPLAVPRRRACALELLDELGRTSRTLEDQR